ncbi:hypothetical protein [Bosea sp. 124]|nr:hypothetical protein [Bosea sp. 124]
MPVTEERTKSKTITCSVPIEPLVPARFRHNQAGISDSRQGELFGSMLSN